MKCGLNVTSIRIICGLIHIIRMWLLCGLYGFVTIVTAATFNPQCGFSLEVMQNVASNWIMWLILLGTTTSHIQYTMWLSAYSSFCRGFFAYSKELQTDIIACKCQKKNVICSYVNNKNTRMVSITSFWCLHC